MLDDANGEIGVHWKLGFIENGGSFSETILDHAQEAFDEGVQAFTSHVPLEAERSEHVSPNSRLI